MKEIKNLILFNCPNEITETHLLIWLKHAYDLGIKGKNIENFRIERREETYKLVCDEISFVRPRISFNKLPDYVLNEKS